MKEKEIELIRKQIEKLNVKDFDLESWKISTIIIFERIFGYDSPKIAKIKSIHQDLSSWSLRDTLGTSSGYEALKKYGKEILEACIMELETLGISDNETKSTKPKSLSFKVLLASLENELKVSQFKNLINISSIKNKKEREGKITEFLSNLDSESVLRIVANILNHSKVVEILQTQ
ncbi:MAG: hypothetical protein IIB05_09645 [Bacteroidetes bacterium]|nr:hypothetical protein [Bacteroidota bacterium]